jgi:hypothetical protein
MLETEKISQKFQTNPQKKPTRYSIHGGSVAFGPMPDPAILNRAMVNRVAAAVGVRCVNT